MFLMSAALALGMQTAQPVIVTISGRADQCTYQVDGTTLSEAAFKERAREWIAPQREVHIRAAGGDTPYRCIGKSIYLVQQAGVKVVGFISQPTDPEVPDDMVEPD